MTDRTLPTGQSADLVSYAVMSNGAELDGSFNLVSITVDKSVNRIPTARLVFSDGDASAESFPLSDRDELIPGREIEIAAGYHNENETIFKGTVIKQTVRSKADKTASLVVECKDKAYAMTLGRRNRYFTDETDSAIIEEILGAQGLDNDIEATEVQHRTLVQYSTTDWDFITTRAEANGKLVLVDDGKVTIRAAAIEGTTTATLLFGATLLSFDLTLDATHQHGDVTCAAWDSANQQVVEGTGEDPGLDMPGNLSPGDLGAATVSSVRHIHTGGLASDEVEAWASARRRKNTLSQTRGVLTCTGLAAVKPGSKIEIAGVGDRFNGAAFVSGVRHAISDGGWEMSVQVGVQAEFFGAETDIADPPAAALLPAINGLQVGLVTQLQDDPDGEHRILVRMPVVDNDAEGTWARVATLDAGDGRGTFFRPEIGDEVVLGFFNDDPRQPVVLGMLNSSAKAPALTASDDNHEKGVFSRDGVKIAINDDLQSLTLETPEGNAIVLSHDEAAITITDENGNSITLDADGIALSSASDLTISAQGDITIEGVNVSVSASASFSASGSAGAELSSSATTDVKGSIVNIN